MRSGIDLLVLDAHGVVFNNPFRPFLRELAERTGQTPRALLDRWDRELRLPAWTGELDEDRLWRRLLGSSRGSFSGDEWRALLEARYELGPAASRLESWRARVPVWILSNHRSEWLHPRLERFGLGHLFERVLVSDVLRAAKPSARAYLPILRSGYARGRVLLVDDKECNVRSARDQGFLALRATAEPVSLLAVDRCLFEADEHQGQVIPIEETSGERP